MEEIELSWMAGFFEGEGCVSFSDKHHYSLRVSIDNLQRECLEVFKERFGGGRIRLSHKSEPYRGWKWYLTGGHKLVKFAKELSPYIHGKKSMKKINLILTHYSQHRKKDVVHR